MPNTDPPDAYSVDCQWCGDDPRSTAFCCKACEDASRSANAEPVEDWSEYIAADHDADLAYLSRLGHGAGAR